VSVQSPGLPSILFLAYVLAGLPWAAFKSAWHVRTVGLPPGERVWTSTIVMLALLFVLAWLVGRSFDYDAWAVPPLGPRAWLAAAGALAFCFLLRALARALTPEAERRKLAVFKLAPRTRKEWLLWTAAVVLASVSEEIAYRGVAMSILWYALGDPWLATAISALAFGLAHAVQGWRSVLIVTVFGLVMQALVLYTGTLVLAMLVHAVYDFVAGYAIAREAAAMNEEKTALGDV
jgi:membrane protease YdiL (CAAX protease family)